ncbi:MAG: Asp-tRNA(Asn)/Glu-tRNA(Gln) amidotransferase subunit GatB [Candidatus Omnitrophica bacterium]|nr:Asp-tRNA(Asn)/Glu-tRNA(Gln) amidotransferase subunit GatB [Candidatus Omnitrophota bacterium]MCM8770627.1 Asp-tRNA(Asn)/Glu-tRNA(Gln) amidotransferase subunit GatB [Candidatus Omnitrophota bacterium]
MNYEPVIGLEVHVQLNTKTKAFCGCAVEFGREPNSLTCPVCLGFPGALPVLNQTAFEYALKVALALNCSIQKDTKFDRKNYFYPDLPKNYQISQYDLPLSLNGYLEIETQDKIKHIGIRRVHLEEDAGKLIHLKNESLVDFNRCGTPLLEIVSEPQINSAQEAYDYLMTLKTVIQYLEVSDCDMEKGTLRCDANISLRKIGQEELGEKVELKNMNSFKAVRDALDFEIRRQAELLSKNKKVVQETRLWDDRRLQTFSMRTKEEAADYRYFPEPDLPLFSIPDTLIEKIKNSLPELPRSRLMRLIKDYNLPPYDAKIIIQDKGLADYFEDCFKIYPKAKLISNWLIGPVLAELNSRKLEIKQLKLKPGDLIELIESVEEGQISNLVAKDVLKAMLDAPGESASSIIKERNLAQISDTAKLEEIIQEVLKENPRSVKDYLSGKENALMFLVGQVMKKSSGKANPKIVQEILKGRLKNV